MTESEDRYSRQIRFAGIGPEGQKHLRGASAVLVGCGALGSLQADLLVRAGVGRLRILDRDFVEWSNLARQVLFDEADARDLLPKAVAAAHHLRRINSEVEIEDIVVDVTPGNAESLLAGFDVILDGTDNFEIRFLINDVAIKHSIPWIYGGCVGAYGVCLTILPGETACLSCLMPELPPPGSAETCDTAGVIGPVVGVIASLQAAEALKILAGRRECVRPGLLSLDLWQGTQQEIRVGRDAACVTCGARTLQYLVGGEGRTLSTRLCGRNAVQVSPAEAVTHDLEALASRLRRVGAVTSNAFLVRCEVDGHQLTVFRDGRALIGGTDDVALARSLYARYVGS